jgi:hypothetical protein
MQPLELSITLDKQGERFTHLQASNEVYLCNYFMSCHYSQLILLLLIHVRD